MLESEEFLNLLEKVGSSLLNGGLLHQSFARILDIKNDELPYYTSEYASPYTKLHLTGLPAIQEQ